MGCTSEAHFYVVGSRVVRRAAHYDAERLLSESIVAVKKAP